MQKSDAYISLKEAARISGYSPDYIGQLIRKGKLPGKQVFSNVAWMTTEDAIREYIEKDREKKAGGEDTTAGSSTNGAWKGRIFSVDTLMRIYTAMAWIVIVVAALFAVFLMYVLAANVDHAIERNLGTAVETSL